MAQRMSEVIRRTMPELRIEPSSKRVRALLDGAVVVDSTAAMLVWEPKRIVPTYAVPEGDIQGTIVRDDSAVEASRFDTARVWDPRVPFAVRATAGEAVSIGSGDRTVAGFRADDPDLVGYVILDFQGFDEWREDDDAVISHPHDPFSRIDIRTSSRHVVISVGETVIAQTTRARMLYETGLPPRMYVPRDDVLAELLPSETVTRCAYKGVATYHCPVVNGEPLADLGWSYEHPLIDAVEVTGYVSFFNEKVDVTIDGVPQARPVTSWS